jgi:hypothetical protein
MTGEQMTTGDLISVLNELASSGSTDSLESRAEFWPPGSRFLTRGLRDGMEALMELASDLRIGWDLNAGWRCDVEFDLFKVDACDNHPDFGRDLSAEFSARTPQGAMAGAILSILRLRAERVGLPANPEPADPLEVARSALLKIAAGRTLGLPRMHGDDMARLAQEALAALKEARK